MVFDSHPPGQPAASQYQPGQYQLPLGHGAFLSPGGYLGYGTSSFADFLAGAAPGLLPGAGSALPPGGAGPASAAGGRDLAASVPHGTTIVAASFEGGVVMAGDRRATAGHMIAQRDIEKVFRSDEFSCVAISGAAGIGIDLVRLFSVELEHYEKLEGDPLSLEGKANRLAQMIKQTDPRLRLEGLLDPATLAAALDRGRRMTIDEAMDLVVRIGDAVPADDRAS